MPLIRVVDSDVDRKRASRNISPLVRMKKLYCLDLHGFRRSAELMHNIGVSPNTACFDSASLASDSASSLRDY